MTIEGDQLVSGDASQLRQVLANLMRNALTHTPAGSPIELSVSDARRRRPRRGPRPRAGTPRGHRGQRLRAVLAQRRRPRARPGRRRPGPRDRRGDRRRARRPRERAQRARRRRLVRDRAARRAGERRSATRDRRTDSGLTGRRGARRSQRGALPPSVRRSARARRTPPGTAAPRPSDPRADGSRAAR